MSDKFCILRAIVIVLALLSQEVMVRAANVEVLNCRLVFQRIQPSNNHPGTFDSALLATLLQKHLITQLNPDLRVSQSDLDNISFHDPQAVGKYFLQKNIRQENIRHALSATYIVGEIGSGFLIDDRGTFVTNNHVLQALKASGKIDYVIDSEGMPVDFDRNYQVLYYEEGLYQNAIKTPKALHFRYPDIAIIRIPALAGRSYISINNQVPNHSSPVAALGYYHVNGRRNYPELRVAVGRVLAHDANEVKASCPIKPGYSGGPLVDEDGLLIGVSEPPRGKPRGFTGAAA